MPLNVDNALFKVKHYKVSSKVENENNPTQLRHTIIII